MEVIDAREALQRGADRGQVERGREAPGAGPDDPAGVQKLGISDQTVKFHVASIAAKLGATNRTDAVRLALRRGLLTL